MRLNARLLASKGRTPAESLEHNGLLDHERRTWMATVARQPTTGPATGTLRTGATLMAAAGLAFIGYAVIFFVRNFTGGFLELGIGHHEVDVGRAEIRAFSPDLYEYLSHLHIAVAGLLAATGLATAALAWYGVRSGQWWAYVTAVAAPVLGLAVALPAHYAYDLDTLGHLGPIYVATTVFLVGTLLALGPLVKARRRGGS